MTSAGTKQLRAQSKSCWWVWVGSVSHWEQPEKHVTWMHPWPEDISFVCQLIPADTLNQPSSLESPEDLLSSQWLPPALNTIFINILYFWLSALPVMQIFAHNFSVLPRTCLSAEGRVKQEQIPSFRLEALWCCSAFQLNHVTLCFSGAF